MDSNVMTEGCFVILQRGSFMKLCKLISSRPQVLGRKSEKLNVSFEGVAGLPFGSYFKLLSKGNRSALQPLSFEELTEVQQIDGDSGVDNRNLADDGTSQKLTREEILELKNSGASGEEVIQAITSNSSTFRSKTKYSQEKYINKKGKKYTEPIVLHRPSLDLLADMFFTQEPWKVSHLRPDSLFQLLALSNVFPGCRAAVFDTGTKNLVTAGLLHRIGTDGRLVNVYYGNKPFGSPEATALAGMNFMRADMVPLSNISINRLHIVQPPGKPTCDDSEPVIEDSLTAILPTSTNGSTENGSAVAAVKQGKFLRNREQDESVSSSVLAGGVSTLVVACKQHPLAPTLALLPFLLPGCPFVIFSPFKEALSEVYLELKNNGGTNLRLSETWLREYQVLPERTHPEVNMSGGGGYLLCGTKIRTGDQF